VAGVHLAISYVRLWRVLLLFRSAHPILEQLLMPVVALLLLSLLQGLARRALLRHAEAELVQGAGLRAQGCAVACFTTRAKSSGDVAALARLRLFR